MMHINHGKYYIDNSEKIANEFNYFYVSIGLNLAKDINYNVNPLFYVNSVDQIHYKLLFSMYLLLK